MTDRRPSLDWATHLGDHVPTELAEEIQVFESQMHLRRLGKVDDKIFAEARLRRGVYGQRYDNGRRNNGDKTVSIPYPCGALTKGPDTVWDAPGMMRIKIPMGVISNDQLHTLAELAEEYSDGILHVTTRQDVQLHFVHIDDTPSLMRRLAAVGITTREACGNAVRNVTACQFSGACADQAFDVTPYARAAMHYLLGHKDTQDFGRKLKIGFSGCRPHPCGLALINDIGCIGTTRTTDGAIETGFEFYVGGGLGAVPHQAQLLFEFIPAEELLPMCQAVCRVFARLGERNNRARARLKFLVQKLGNDEFRRIVDEERARIPPDERWHAHLDSIDKSREKPVCAPAPLGAGPHPDGFAAWHQSNVWRQPDAGYATATVRLPLGDLTSDQARALSELSRRFAGNTMRFTIEQNLVIRWVSRRDLPELFSELQRIGLASAGASTIADITACPGTDTCKLGIASSRGLAGVLERRLADRYSGRPEVAALHIKASGCFNSCGQHHIADIGLLGVSRVADGRRVAHFQLVIGGQWTNNGGSYGLAIGAFPAKRVPDLIDRIIETWTSERHDGESLKAFIERIGRAKLKKSLDDLRQIPSYEQDPSFYTDWGDAREYTIGDLGVGECAGEVISRAEFGLHQSEREVFEAQLALEHGDSSQAAALAYRSMLSAARALVGIHNVDIGDGPDEIVAEFQRHYHDTGLFHDPFAGAKFAMYLLRAHDAPPSGDSDEATRSAIEEAQLFIEAAHSCYHRMQEASS